jgi:hypothetical protein
MVVKCGKSDIPLDIEARFIEVFPSIFSVHVPPQLHLRSRQRGPCLSLEQSGLWGQEFTWKIRPQRQTTTPSLIVLSVLHKECVELLTGKKSLVQCVFKERSL